MTRVFVSFSHPQGQWVFDRLAPVLKAGGVEVLIDTERFRVGRALKGEMDRIQDQANRQILVITEAYLHSDYDAALMEKILDTAIKRGDMVLRELMYGESRLPGEWDYFCGFLTRDSQPPPDDPEIFRSLKRRELITVEGDQWRLRVPLMQRWLRERG